METNDKVKYRGILKATSIFGGVQVFNILISIIKSKIIAILLGPYGMGLSTLFLSTTSIISSFTSLGLNISGVRAIAEAFPDEKKVAANYFTLKKLVWFTGLLGALLTLFLSPILSELTFNSENFTTEFRILSIILLINQLISAETVLLQGSSKIKFLAKSNLIGSSVGLVLSIILYYYLGVEGIVPAILVSGAISLGVINIFSRKLKIEEIKINLKDAFKQGAPMINLGIVLSLSGLMELVASYVIRIFIGNVGGIDQVGLYNAGFSIIGSYVALVFTAMSTDYYPQLSRISNDSEASEKLINQQSEITLLIICPILCIFLIYINYIIVLLYSNKFTGINMMIQWASLGTFFKAISWAVAFIFLAKGKSKLFFWLQVIANSYILLLNVIFYKYFGLTGLGISYLIGYFILAIHVLFLARRFAFKYNYTFIRIFIITFFLASICFLIRNYLENIYAIIAGSLIIFISIYFSFNEMNKRIDINNLIKTKFKR